MDSEINKYLALLSEGKNLRNNLSNLSYLYFLQRNYKEAIRYGFDTIKEDGKWFKGYYRVAKAYELIADRDKAMEYYKKMAGLINADKSEYLDSMYNIDVNILMNWVLNEGGVVNNIKVEFYDTDYRGLCVNKLSRKDEVLIGVPIKCAISLEDSKNSKFNKELLSKGFVFDSDHSIMSIELLNVKYSDDKRNYLVNALPKYFSNIPINFRNEELNLLENSFALVKIAQKIHHLKGEYNRIVKALKELGINEFYSLEDFVWARTCIITRIYAIKRNMPDKEDIGNEKENKREVKDNVLMPFADMANHEMNPNTHWYFDNDSGLFTVMAKRDINVGENIYESYGFKSNYRYFVNYGFTMEHNNHDEAAIILHPELRKAFREKTFLDSRILEVFNKTPYITQVGYSTTNDLYKDLIESVKSLVEQDTEESIANFMIGVLEDTLKHYPTTAEQDVKLLKKELSFNEKNCVVQRLSEKRIYKFHLDHFRKLKKDCLKKHKKFRQ
jgi:tetratricopeptide (TPR) repeat protein